MKHTHNPDYRTDEKEKIKTKINKTEHNTEVAEEIISKSNDKRLKNTLEEKNDRRRAAINVMKRELKED